MENQIEKKMENEMETGGIQVVASQISEHNFFLIVGTPQQGTPNFGKLPGSNTADGFQLTLWSAPRTGMPGGAA